MKPFAIFPIIYVFDCMIAMTYNKKNQVHISRASGNTCSVDVPLLLRNGEGYEQNPYALSAMGPMTQKNAEGFDYRMNQLLVVNVNMTEVFED